MRATPWIVVAGLLAGCDNGKEHADPVPRPDAGLDAAVPSWWQPAPGAVGAWDLQVRAPFDVSAPHAMFDLDLWALVPAATTLDYGDGAPVTVPAGSQAATIAALRARATPPVIICRIATGAIRLSDPDAGKFPGFAASPPDRPDAPAAGSAIGWSTQDPAAPDERFLDLRAASRDAWAPLVWKRLDLARDLGCDGVEADRNDSITSNPGWTMAPAEQTSWYAEVAAQAHARGLSVGMKNGTTLPGQVDALADDFDWLLVERCGEYDDCDVTRPFIQAGKAVLAVDFDTSAEGITQPAATLCTRQQSAQVVDGLVKDVALTSAVRVSCAP